MSRGRCRGRNSLEIGRGRGECQGAGGIFDFIFFRVVADGGAGGDGAGGNIIAHKFSQLCQLHNKRLQSFQLHERIICVWNALSPMNTREVEEVCSGPKSSFKGVQLSLQSGNTF